MIARGLDPDVDALPEDEEEALMQEEEDVGDIRLANKKPERKAGRSARGDGKVHLTQFFLSPLTHLPFSP